VVKLIKKYQLSNYTINLMTMDYGSPSGGNCIVKNGECDMGASAVQAAINLNKQYGIPLSKIEITPMIGGNDTPNETFRLEDISVVVNYAKQNGIAGVHFWSLDVIRTAHRATLHQPVTPTVKQVHWASPKPSDRLRLLKQNPRTAMTRGIFLSCSLHHTALATLSNHCPATLPLSKYRHF
jgi:hypothetical protein